MIKLVRVDHRLLHGQVAVSWFNALDANTIFVVNDEVAKDEFRKDAIRLAKPSNAKLVMQSVDKAVTSINSGITDKYAMLVVVGNVADAVRLINGTNNALKSLNLGGTRPGENKKAYSATINLTDKDHEELIAIEKQGVEVYIQQVPNDTKKKLD